MNYQDIAVEAVTEFGVGLVESLSGTIYWYESAQKQAERQASAWMSRKSGRTWFAHNANGVRYSGTKAQVAEWCVDQAVNGLTALEGETTASSDDAPTDICSALNMAISAGEHLRKYLPADEYLTEADHMAVALLEKAKRFK